MKEGLHKEFIEVLEEHFGKYSPDGNGFKDARSKVIANFLGYSEGHFSSLITNSDKISEDKLRRAIDVAKRLIEHSNQFSGYEKRTQKDKRQNIIIFLLIGITIGALVTALLQLDRENQSHIGLLDMFDQANVSPYVSKNEAPDYCPCAAYEGKWKLKENGYKFPLHSNIDGLHYLAKSSDARFKCAKGGSLPFELGDQRIEIGNKLYGFEVLENEIWYDKEHTPTDEYIEVDSIGNKRFKESYNNKVFENDPDFELVATVKSYFLDEFIISPTEIRRSGEHLGRLYDYKNTALIQKLESMNVDWDLDQLIGDFKFNCDPIKNPYPNTNLLTEGSYLPFECRYMENPYFPEGIPYTKTFHFIKQNYSSSFSDSDCK